MKTKVHIKCKSFDFEKLFEKKGYAYFNKGNYNLNIIGVRSNQNNKVTNKYDDCLVVITIQIQVGNVKFTLLLQTQESLL